MPFFPQPVFQQIAANAAAIDKEGQYPEEAFEWMADAGMLQVGLPGEPLDFNKPDTPALLQLLLQVGMANLSVGRIYEGHINALQLVQLYATPSQNRNGSRWPVRESCLAYEYTRCRRHKNSRYRKRAIPAGSCKPFVPGLVWYSVHSLPAN